MNVGGDLNYQQGKHISYKKGSSDGWVKLIIAAVIAGGILYYLGWVGK